MRERGPARLAGIEVIRRGWISNPFECENCQAGGGKGPPAFDKSRLASCEVLHYLTLEESAGLDDAGSQPVALMSAWFVIIALVGLGVLIGWPGVGLLSRRRRVGEVAARVQREDALKHIYKLVVNGRRPTLESIAGALHLHTNRAADLVADLESRGLVTFTSGEMQLTPSGRSSALHIIRAHRLWESYLAEATGVAETAWHGLAEDREHHLTPEQADALSAQLGHPSHDPHGDLIPLAGDALAADPGRSLNVLEVNEAGLINHIEDEPETIYAQVVAEGLRPGMVVRVLEKGPLSIRFWAEGDEHVLAPMLANNISVVPAPAGGRLEEPVCLSDLKPGDRARVVTVSRTCRGAERRRLLDLGFVPGSEVSVEWNSPTGDPTAYRVRGTVLALRREQAASIRVTPLERNTA